MLARVEEQHKSLYQLEHKEKRSEQQINPKHLKKTMVKNLFFLFAFLEF